MVLSGLPGGLPWPPRPELPTSLRVSDKEELLHIPFVVEIDESLTLAEGETGVIIPQEIYDRGTSTNLSSGIDGHLLRYGLAFWDKIALINAGGAAPG